MNRAPSAIIFLMVLVFTFSALSAQTNVKIDKKEFKTIEDGFKEAWENIADGDKCFSLGGGMYREAIPYYLAAIEYNPLNPELNYKTGVCCLLGDRPEQSLKFFLSSLEAKAEVAPDILILTGLSYQSNGDFSLAIDYYNRYSDVKKESGETDQRVNKYIGECKRALKMSAESVSGELVNVGVGINSEADDYAPSPAMDNTILYFTSRRSSGAGSTRNRSDMKYDESILLSKMVNGEWIPSEMAGKNLATEMNEGILHVNNTNDLMYLYAGWSGNGDIYVSQFTREKWTKPQAMPGAVNSDARETSFSVTGDGNEQFFTSDRKKGGSGGRDIWYMKKIKKDKWSSPSNLGDVVNTQGNEESVWVSPGGDTLWFSSNGRNGIGGYDIYVTCRDSLGSWTSPHNMGMPVNSQWDDMFYRPVGQDGTRAYLTSNRPGGIGGFDIYEIFMHAVDTLESVAPGLTPLIVPDSLSVPHHDQDILKMKIQFR